MLFVYSIGVGCLMFFERVIKLCVFGIAVLVNLLLSDGPVFE